ncbi:hypothetical protein LWI28_007698 [Acer negundo]|uniref:Uncharacterized protein n=1 Tax=Acer negundo TaxID=4023 RepID=A0AAD5NIH2_ACENE|nr:hypothetical protein LWI28_007698 [Acer negundo]
MNDPDANEVTYKSMCGMMIKVLFDVLPKVLPQPVVKDVFPNESTEKNTSEVITKVMYDVLPKVLPHALNDVLPKNLYNVHGTASDFANIKDKTEEVDNKDSEAIKSDGHPSKVNECADKKDYPKEIDNKDSEALIRDERASKVDEFEVAVEEHIF